MYGEEIDNLDRTFISFFFIILKSFNFSWLKPNRCKRPCITMWVKWSDNFLFCNLDSFLIFSKDITISPRIIFDVFLVINLSSFCGKDKTFVDLLIFLYLLLIFLMPLSLVNKTEIVYHACEWDKNYFSKKLSEDLSVFLEKNKDDIEFCFLERML